MTPEQLRESLQDALVLNSNAHAWLRVIRAGETSQDDSAYRTMFGGGQFSEWKHPRVVNHAAGLASTAAGAYQFLARTWDECAAALGLSDFSPASQDLAAMYLTQRRGALQDVLDGRIEQAIAKCAKEWASLPGSPYGQPTRTLAQALATYRQYGGQMQAAAPAPTIPPGEAPDWAPPPPKESTMPIAPIIAAVLPTLIESIPKLGRIFGSGSEVAERNIKAAETVVETITKATGAVNAQDAAEKVKASPEAAKAATAAVDAIWYELTEAGGGGIAAARKADAEAQAGGWRAMLSSPSLVVAALLLPLVYLLVLSLIGLIGTASWSDDVRAGLAGSLISAIVGGLCGYYYGTMTSRNRAPQ